MKSAAVQRWTRVEVSPPVAGDVPAVTGSDLAGRASARQPLARALNHLVLPAAVNEDEPVCEELEAGYSSGGPMGPEGQERSSVGRRR